jgi:mevalonate kinase
MKYGSKWKEGFDNNTETLTNTTTDDSDKMVDEIEKEVEKLIDGDMLNEENIDNELKKMKKIEEKTKPENINKLLEKQQKILDKLEKYKPLLNTIQNIGKNLGLATTPPPSSSSS